MFSEPLIASRIPSFSSWLVTIKRYAPAWKPTLPSAFFFQRQSTDSGRTQCLLHLLALLSRTWTHLWCCQLYLPNWWVPPWFSFSSYNTVEGLADALHEIETQAARSTVLIAPIPFFVAYTLTCRPLVNPAEWSNRNRSLLSVLSPFVASWCVALLFSCRTPRSIFLHHF